MQPVTINLGAFQDPDAYSKTGNWLIDNPLLVWFLLAIVLCADFLFFIYHPANIMWFLVLLAIAICFFIHRHTRKRALGALFYAQMKRFADDNNFTLMKKLDDSSMEGTLFNLGNNDHNTYAPMKGKLYDYPFKMYWDYFTQGSGKYKSSYQYGVIELDLPKHLPHIFVDGLAAGGLLVYEPLGAFSESDMIMLEGNFYKKFRVFCIDAYRIAALVILNPAFMQALLDQGNDYDIELVGKKAFLYFRNAAPPSETTVMQLLSGAEFLILELQKQLDTFQFTPDDRQPEHIRRLFSSKLFGI